ncbi:MAG: hypothetical protein KC505_03955 [Myxococcales bacterium]|nr:hypothetical protein [Myxococcales bacterium]USN51731.1 MAG: hypothetical protein H6731_04810 [Myxococcales bacterium]
MMNENSLADIAIYRKTVLLTTLVVLILLSTAIFFCWYLNFYFLIKTLIGAMLGTLLASINVFALAYAFYFVAVKKSSKTVVLWPLLTFLILCGAALFLALNHNDYLLGFALGLCSPLIFATIIALRG